MSSNNLMEDEGHARDLPDFIEIDENDFSKYESSSGPSNVSPKSSRSKLGEEVFPCDCSWPHGWREDEVGTEKLETVACGSRSNCINRTLFVECRSGDCPCREHCQNQRFQRKQYKPIRVIGTPGKGHGLKCLESLKASDFIIEYVGEVVSQQQMQKRIEINAQLGQRHYYFMTLQSDQILDATRKGNYSRFMNHSCNPNCATQKWIVNGQVRIGLFALKSIPAGTELTFDYKFVRFSSEAQKCLCGEPNCKGFIGTERKESEFFDTDDESDDEDGLEMKKPSGIDDPEVMAALAKVLLRKDNPKELQPALETLLNTTSQECLKKFVALHGLQILQILLGQQKKEDEIVCLILEILGKLPIATRNALEESKLERVVDALLKEEISEEAKELVASLKTNWANLEHSFVIPKSKAPTISMSFDSSNKSDRSLTPTSLVNSVDSSTTSASAGGYTLDDGPQVVKKRWGGAVSFGSRPVPTREPLRSSRSYDEPFRGRDQSRDHSRDRPRDYPRDKDHREAPRDQRDNRDPQREVKRARTEDAPLAPGWREARTADGKVYYYSEKTRETQWDRPVAAEPTAAQLVEGLKSDRIAEIIERARAGALSKAQEAKASEARTSEVVPDTRTKSPPTTATAEVAADPSLSRIRDEISQVVVKFLSRYTAQFKDQNAFKEMARKLTHGLAEKEYRGLLLNGQLSSFEISKQKRQRIVEYLCQYLKAHGFTNVRPE